MVILTLACALGFALIHLFVGRLVFLDVVPRSRWLSAAGGVAVGYVFLHVLPELATHSQTFAEELGLAPERAERVVYLTALTGLAVFYGLERMVRISRAQAKGQGASDTAGGRVFWLHAGAFALYNVLVGYLLLHREREGTFSLLFYFIAIGLHFVTTDFGLRTDHKWRYEHHGRWVLVAAVLAGWGLGLFVSVSQVAVGFLFAFLAGGVVLNVLKEELPEERESRFWPFLLGAAASSGLLLLV